MITRVAIELNGTVYVGEEGKRHDSVIRSMVEQGIKPPIKGVQGFIDDRGVFLNRRDAAEHAFKCGQLSDEVCPDIILSEDLW